MSVYLHIGVGKTGTTSLQVFLNRFRQEIVQQNFHLLQTGALGAAHHHLASDFGFGNKQYQQGTPSCLATLQAELQENHDKNIIISSENFHSHVTTSKLLMLQQAFSGMDVKVVLYLREQGAWIDSAYRQFVRMGSAASISEVIHRVISNRSVDYYWLYQVWGACFGMNNIILRIYEPSQLQGDTIRDFSSVIGLHLSEEMQAFKPMSNASLSPLETEVLRLMNLVSKKKKDAKKNILGFLRNDETIEHDKYHFMSCEDRYFIRSEFAESNQQLAREYFDRGHGMLFMDKVECDDSAFKLINFF